MNLTRTLIKRLRRQGDRGASGVEYGLVVGLMLLGSTTAIEMMGSRLQEHYEEASEDIGQTDLGHFEVTTTTTLAPLTTTTTTTTTAPPTTTTAAKPLGERVDIKFQDKSYENNNGYRAKVKITLRDENGKKLKDAKITITMTTSGGETNTFTYKTGESGNQTFTWIELDRRDFDVHVEIVSITKGKAIYVPSESEFTLRG